MVLPHSKRKLQPTWVTSEMEFLPRMLDTQVVPWHAQDMEGLLAHRESPCSCLEAERQIIIFLLEIGVVSPLCGEKILDMLMQLPVVLPENGCEKR